MNTRFVRLSDLVYRHTQLIGYIARGGKFQVSERGRIKFDESRPSLDLSMCQIEDIAVGDYVRVHSLLEKPWSAGEDLDERDHLSSELQVIAFVTLNAVVKKVSIKGTFCVLRKEMGGSGSNTTTFVMTGNKLDRVALYFFNALERVA